MSQYVGLDVSVKEVSICVVDASGDVLVRGTVPTDPDMIARFLSEHAPEADRVVHESGILAIWLTRELDKRGLPIICVDARLAHKALSGRVNETDKGDAEGLAHLARTGWFTPVHIRSEASERVRVLIGTRERLIRMRKDLEAHVRGVLKTFGIRMAAIQRSNLRGGFRDQLAHAGQSDLAIELMAEAFNPIHQALCAAAEAIDDELREIARGSDLAQRLMTVPGVGPVVALAYIATLDDEARFKRATDVGAFLGLTPRRYQSGDTDWSGRISKCGDRDLRRLLYSAGFSLISQVRRFSPLRAWAVRLSERKGVRHAAVATARKLSVIMLRIWRDGTTFHWTKEVQA